MRDTIEISDRYSLIKAGTLTFNDIGSDIPLNDWMQGEVDRLKVNAGLKVYEWFFAAGRNEENVKQQLVLENKEIENLRDSRSMSPLSKARGILLIIAHQAAERELRWILKIND